MTLSITSCRDGIRFTATIQPRASRNEIVGVHDQTLKIRLTSPPVDGAANKSCVRFLAKSLGISPSRVRIVNGLTGRTKTIEIDSMEASELLNIIDPATARRSSGDSHV